MQVEHLTTMPAESKLMMNTKLKRVWTNEHGCVESTHNIPGMLIATSLHEPRGQDAQIRAADTTKQPLVLKPRKAVAKSSIIELDTSKSTKYSDNLVTNKLKIYDFLLEHTLWKFMQTNY